jgi:hypothetical protein
MGTRPSSERQVRELLRLTPEYQCIVAARIDFTMATAGRDDLLAKIERAWPTSPTFTQTPR